MTQRRQRKCRWIWWVVFFVLIVATVVVVVLVKQNYFDSKEKTEVGNNAEITKGSVQQETKKDENSKKEDETVEKKKVEQYDGDNPNEKNDLTGVITYAAVNDGRLMVRVNIDQFLDDGLCKIELRKDSEVIYNAEARIVGMATTSTCEGFDVQTSKLSSGKITIDIQLSANGKYGKIVGEVNL